MINRDINKIYHRKKIYLNFLDILCNINLHSAIYTYS